MKSAIKNHIVVPYRSERRFYGHGIPGVDLEQVAGKLIVVEGADGSGRSTQIARLVQWLEGTRPRHRAGGTQTVHARQRRTGAGPGGQHPEPHHPEPVLCDGFRGPAREHHPARAEGRVHRPVRPLYLHPHGARHGPRHGRGLAEEPLRHRPGTGCRLLPQRPARGTGPAHLRQERRRWITGKAAWTWGCRGTCSTAS